MMCPLGALHSHCRTAQGGICRSQSRCSFYIKSAKHLKIALTVEILDRQLLLNDDSILQDIIVLNDIRNNVHISILKYMDL